MTEINATPKKTMEYLMPGPNGIRRKWDDGVKVSLTITPVVCYITSHI